MKNNCNYDIYFAAPFFCKGEKELNLKLLTQIENLGYKVFYPPRDGLVAKEKITSTTNWDFISNKTWACDTEAIINSKLIFAVLDGRSIDEGVCVEIGFAAANQKTIIGYSTDDRTQFPWGHNPMILAPIAKLINSTKMLVDTMAELVD